MKFTQILFLTVFSLWGNSLKSQYTSHSLFHAGYLYQNQSFGEVGGKLLFLKNDDILYRIGGSAVFGKVNDQWTVFPKVQADLLLNFERDVDIWHSYYFLAGVDASTKYIAPKMGFNIFGVLDFSGGYAFSLSELQGKKLSGLQIQATLNIPLVVIQDLTQKKSKKL